MEFWDDIEFFVADEFACPCCSENGIKHSFVLALDNLRRFSGFPFPVNSGYRCPEYNARISSTGLTGPHTTGRAADIGISGERVYAAVILHAHRVGVTGIGLHQKGPHAGRYVHFDTLDNGDTRPTIWTY